MFSGSAGNYNRLVEKATSQLLLEPDWDTTIQICDCIRMADVQAKPALLALRKKVSQDNPHVSLFALQVLESVVKNCGAVVHEELATKECMEFFKDLVKKRPDPVKAKILELIQVWSHAFRNEPNYKIVQDTYHLMKMEGYTFPTLKEADAMFVSEKAPEWKDGECCHRCRVGFSTFQRKHHCRHCGNIFCNKCSSKTAIIPKFGLEREVRVCDSCYEDLSGSANAAKKEEDGGLPQEYLNSPLSQQSQVAAPRSPKTQQTAPPSKSEQEIQEEEELQLALALSMSEAQTKEKEKERNKIRSNYSLYSGSGDVSNNTAQKVAAPEIDTSDMTPELARYLNRNYWQQKSENVTANTTQPSAPTAVAESKLSNAVMQTEGSREKTDELKLQNGESSDEEQFLNALRSSIEIFVNRMKSDHARGRSIATDSSVQTLFMTINAMHPQLIKYLSELEDSRTHFENLQDKLAQLKDAREALDALREEHRQKRQREQEELERQRQIAMAHKLDILRQKKQEYLEYQRQLALQRMQEQEREMQIRLEQQKQLQQMRAMQYGQLQMYGQPTQTYSPGHSAEGSPLHQPHQVQQGPYLHGPMPVPPGAPGHPLPLPQGSMPPQPQGMYSQPGYQTAPGGYHQPPPGGYPPTTYHPGGYGPPTSQPMGMPSGQQMPPPGAQPLQNMPPQGLPQQPPQGLPQQPPGEYQPYNMQNMGNALPNQPGPPMHGGPPSQIPGQPYMPPQQGQYGPPGPGLPQQQQQQPHVQQNDAQLISFD